MGYELDMDHETHEDFEIDDLHDEQIRQFLLSEKEKARERRPIGWQPEGFAPDIDSYWDE